MSALEEGAREDPKAFINRPRWARFLVLGAGPGFNYLAAAVFFFLFFWLWPSPVAGPALELVEVHPGPAADAGLQRGDFITHVDGAAIETDVGFRRSIAASAGAPLMLTVLRQSDAGDTTLQVPVAAKSEEGGFRLGVSPAMRWPNEGVVATAGAAVVNCVGESQRTLMALRALVRREPGVDVGSPVAIVADMKDKIARGSRFFIMMLAVLSVNLGLFNLLPIPSLDGIKMVFLTIEGTIRKDLNATFQVAVNAVGLLLLLVTMFGLMLRDTVRLFG